ncbi:hypothetical protein N7450_007348 [Penicillium hetheringtonii]|uniref:Uncharacterized protein n=1 Tax=Penicillium hetheringtonii TaxID=911720 RepID=A0AAD6DHG9_9EURO|nr:hypothetical protein N7450_007348 [Penicillium hetheringtonii]
MFLFCPDFILSPPFLQVPSILTFSYSPSKQSIPQLNAKQFPHILPMATNPNMRGTASSRNPDSKTAESTSPSSSTPVKKDSTTSQGTSSSNINANTNTNTPSLASRIQSSASSLARSALSPTDYAQTLQSATQGKASSSSSTSTQSPGSSTSTTTGIANNVPPSSSQSTTQPQTFRNTTHAAPGAFSIPNLTEDEFQRAYTDVGTYGRAYYDEPNQSSTILPETTQTLTNSSETTLQSSTGNWKGKQRLQDPVQKEYTTAWERASPHTPPPPPAPEAKTENQDGQAVLSLLSDLNFDAFHNDSDVEIETDLNEPVPLSASEIEILESFRREIQSEFKNSQIQNTGVSGEMKGSIPISSVSLIPDIDEFLRMDGEAQGTHTRTGNTSSSTGAGSDTALRDRVLAELPGSNEWVEVQGRYHDEVWGYLRPALEAAREEIEKKGGGDDGEGHDGDGPAVRRLKMILRHMEGTR